MGRLLLVSMTASMAPVQRAGALVPEPELKPYVSVGNKVDPFNPEGGVMALLPLSERELAVGTWGAGVWILNVDQSHDTKRARRILPPGTGAHALALLPSAQLVAGEGTFVWLVNTSVGSSSNSGCLLATPPGVNTLLGHSGSLLIGTDFGLYILNETLLEKAGHACDGMPQFWGGTFYGNSSVSIAQPRALPDRSIQALLHLSGSCLASDMGLCIAAGTDQGLFLLGLFGPLACLAVDFHVASLLELPSGGLAVGTLDGVLLFRSEDLRPGGEAYARLAKGSAVWAMQLLANGELLLGTSAWNEAVDRGALMFSLEDSDLNNAPSAALASGSIVQALSVLSTGVVAVGGPSGVSLYDLHVRELHATPLLAYL